jgi:hypothetical protein
MECSVTFGSRDRPVGEVIRLRAGKSWTGDSISDRENTVTLDSAPFLYFVHTSSGTHATSYEMRIGRFFQG